MEIEHYIKDEYFISTDKSKLDISVIHDFLASSYWAEEIPLEVVKKSIANSLCFGIYKVDSSFLQSFRQVGFARVISDYTTFGYIADVFVIKENRGKGLSKWLMECILKHAQLQGLRNICLMTNDAHTLYEPFGFKNIPIPENFMAKKIDGIYKKNNK
jgi:N-acetylglutamate synthase-like GNAT family acetyltransferase